MKMVKIIVRPDGTGTLIEYEEGEKQEGLCDDKEKYKDKICLIKGVSNGA